jgi:hypothetical protein
VADEATRGNKLAVFNHNCRWMTVPDFLLLNEEDWPNEDRQETDEGVSQDDLEFRPVHQQQLKPSHQTTFSSGEQVQTRAHANSMTRI